MATKTATAGTKTERSSAGNGATFQNDLREFITACEKRGELARVESAHWDRELGAVTEVLYRQKVEKSPMLLFDGIPDYPRGFRCAYGMFGSPYRLSLVLGMEDTGSRMSRIGKAELTQGRVPAVDDVLADIDAVTLTDVQEVAEAVLSASPTLAVIGPFGSPAELGLTA